MSGYRIRVSPDGFARSTVGLDLKTHYEVTVDEAAADRYASRERAERIAARFPHAVVEAVPA